MMKNKSILMIALAMIVIFASVGSAGTRIVNGIDSCFPPFSFVDNHGNPTGFDVEAMTWVAREMGMEVRHRPTKWDGIINSLINKKIDIIASGMSISDARKAKVNFSIPYWKIEQVMMVKKNSTATVDDILNGKKTIGVQPGTSEAKWLTDEAKNNGWNYKLKYYRSAPDAVKDLLNGKIAATAMDDAPAKIIASRKKVKIIGPFGMECESFAYAVRKEDTVLLARVNKSLERLMATKHWQRLMRKYSIGR